MSTPTSPSPIILVSGEVKPAQWEQIKAAIPGADCRYFDKLSELEEHAAEAEIVAGRLTPE
jgi:hypothetical protein